MAMSFDARIMRRKTNVRQFVTCRSVLLFFFAFEICILGSAFVANDEAPSLDYFLRLTYCPVSLVPDLGVFLNRLFSSIAFPIASGNEKVEVGKDQEKAQSEKDSHSKNRGGEKTKLTFRYLYHENIS